MKVTLLFRPGPTAVENDYIMTTVHTVTTPTLPRGLPAFPEKPTYYTVYIATKQWRRVEEALKDPEDFLIVEGYPVYDEKRQSIAVYVTMATTKKLQAARRQQKQQQPVKQ